MKIRTLFIFILLITLTISLPIGQVFAIDGETSDSYIIYDQNNRQIMEKISVEIGDSFITADLEEYEVYEIDGNKAYARKIGNLKIVKTKELTNAKTLNASNSPQTICLYMTHNDESYTPTDGYDSIYGAGGIHDVVKELKDELEKANYNVVLDETLHIPHNSSAYSRSGLTATKLFNTYNPDAQFDIHRDGVSKSYYYTNQNGENLSKIRIVVGKSNPNYQKNYEFAKTLFATGNSLYPWLFSDIYSGSGHYNQALKETCLLFEMGTYLIEKDYVFNSIPYLVEAINSVLYNPVEENPDNSTPSIDNDFSNSQTPSEDITSPSQDENDTTEQSPSNNNWLWAIVTSALIIAGLTITSIIFYKKKNTKNIRNMKKDKKDGN